MENNRISQINDIQWIFGKAIYTMGSAFCVNTQQKKQ